VRFAYSAARRATCARRRRSGSCGELRVLQIPHSAETAAGFTCPGGEPVGGGRGEDSGIAREGAAGWLRGDEDRQVFAPGWCSGLGLAQAFLGDPQLLILDEPTSGLDPAGRKGNFGIAAGAESAGKTVFLSSHILPEVEQICDRIVIIDRGRLLRAARLQEMLSTGDRVELVADRITEEIEQAAAACGAVVERGPHGVRIVLDAARSARWRSAVERRMRRGEHQSGEEFARRGFSESGGT